MPSDQLAQAHSIPFQLLSMVEQNAAHQHQREAETKRGLDAVPALWAAGLTELRDRILEMIVTEWELTRRMLGEVYGGAFSERRPSVEAMMELRSEGLRSLHRQQCDLLK